MYFIGIDISKYKHDCFIATETGKVISEHFTFSNDYKGFEKLLALLNSLDPTIEKRIGFEATGNYGINLKLFLEKHNFSFMEVNPYTLKQFIKSQTLRRTKTDKADAIAIAQKLISVPYKPYPKLFYHIFSLKSLTRLRNSLVKQRSFYLVQITNVLDMIFPEFKPFFNNKFNATSFFILNNYKNPDTIANLQDSDFDKINRISRGHFSYMNFIKLKDLAKNSVGESNSIFELELVSLLDSYFNLVKNIDVLDSNIESTIKEINPPTLTIKGIGLISAAIIISEFGNISSFKSPDAMLAFAGIEPSVIESGTMSQNGKMVKHGSDNLRYALMNIAGYVVMHEPTFAKYYHKKRSEGKAHRVALSHVVKKLLRVIYCLETKNISFDSSKLV